MPVSVVQILHTVWTKASRGGEGARRRNAVPEALPLPEPLVTGEGAHRLHLIHFAEGPWLGLHSTEIKDWAALSTIEWSQRRLDGLTETTGLDPDAAKTARRLAKARRSPRGSPNLHEGRWLRRLEKQFQAIQLLGDFTPSEKWEASNDPGCLQLTKVELEVVEGGISVRMGTRALFTVRAGEWGRVRYNWRYSAGQSWSYEGGWRYSKTVVNIGLFDQPQAEVFIGTTPTHEASRMRDLR